MDGNSTETLLEVRRLAKRTLGDYFDSHGFLECTAPTLTLLTGACETISTLFSLDYFEQKVHLAQTAQLQLEMLVKVLGRSVWSFDHSFRAESRITPRHLTEFCLVEAEVPNIDLGQLMKIQEALLLACIEGMAQEGTGIAAPFEKHIASLTSLRFPLRVLEYQDAVKILQSSGVSINIGDDLGIEEELMLLRHFNSVPFFLIHHPPAIKYFNMKRSACDEYVLSVDLIASPFGEMSGGAEREEDLDRLKKNLYASSMWADIKRAGLDQKEFDWYLDLWIDGSPGMRAGFGIGFERLIGFLTGIQDIRSCIDFPRNRAILFP